MSNIAPSNPLKNPIQAVEGLVGSAGGDPRPLQRSTLFQGANQGPAQVAAAIAGVSTPAKSTDDAPYFTNNEGIPLPTTAHSLNVGGIPVVSDVHLFQKQQNFNRSKTLERMVHPCGSGAFGYFELTKDVSKFTKVSCDLSCGLAHFLIVTVGQLPSDGGIKDPNLYPFFYRHFWP